MKDITYEPNEHIVKTYAVRTTLSLAEFDCLRGKYRVHVIRAGASTGSWNISGEFSAANETRPILEWAIGHEIGHQVWRDLGLSKLINTNQFEFKNRDIVKEIFCDLHGFIRYCRKTGRSVSLETLRGLARINIAYTNWRCDGHNGNFSANEAAKTDQTPKHYGALEYLLRFKFLIENFNDIIVDGKADLNKFIGSIGKLTPLLDQFKKFIK